MAAAASTMITVNPREDMKIDDIRWVGANQ
jgi:hypothetical protein